MKGADLVVAIYKLSNLPFISLPLYLEGISNIDFQNVESMI